EERDLVAGSIWEGGTDPRLLAVGRDTSCTLSRGRSRDGKERSLENRWICDSTGRLRWSPGPTVGSDERSPRRSPRAAPTSRCRTTPIETGRRRRRRRYESTGGAPWWSRSTSGWKRRGGGRLPPTAERSGGAT